MVLFLASSQLLLVLIAGSAAIRSPENTLLLADINDPSSFLGQLLFIVSGLTVAVSVWFAGRFLDHRKFKSFGFFLTRDWWLDFAFGLSLGTLLMTAIFITEWTAGWIQIQAIPNDGRFNLPSLGISLVTFIIIGFYEELLMRGYLIKNLSEGLAGLPGGPRSAILIAALINSVVFGFIHASNPNSTIWSSLNIGLAGLFLAAGYLITGQLAIPIGIHISWNFFQGSVFGFPVSGAAFSRFSIFKINQLGPDIWTGGKFGPEGGFLGIFAVLIGTALIALWIRLRQGAVDLEFSLTEYQFQRQNDSDNINHSLGEPAIFVEANNKLQFPQQLVWDWNGTLLDDLDLCLEIINNILESRGLPILTRELYREVFDFPVEDYYRRIGFDFSIEPFEDISTEFITTYELRRSECQLMDGARQALKIVSQLGIPQNIISASKLDYLNPAVKEYGIFSYFRDVLGLDNHHAAGKLALAEKFLVSNELDPENVLVIGDTVHDSVIAHSLGMNCVLIPNGHHSERRLQQTDTAIVNSLGELSTLLKKLSNRRR
jgi:uncharacterized protein